MSFWLKLFGWVLLFVGILEVIVVTLLYAVVGIATIKDDPSLAWLVILAPWGLLSGILFASGFLVCGAIMFVGGRALDYMGQKTPERRRPRRSTRPSRHVGSGAKRPHARGPKNLARIRFCKACAKDIGWDDRHCRHCGAAQ